LKNNIVAFAKEIWQWEYTIAIEWKGVGWWRGYNS